MGVVCGNVKYNGSNVTEVHHIRFKQGSTEIALDHTTTSGAYSVNIPAGTYSVEISCDGTTWQVASPSSIMVITSPQPNRHFSHAAC